MAERTAWYTPPRTRGTREFWDGAQAGRLVLPRCSRCQTWIYYPRLFCPACSSGELAWQTASGDGEVYSFTPVYLRFPTLPADWPMPYVLALVKLHEGPIMMSNIVHCQPEEVRIGMPVHVVFEGDGVPLFEPAGSAAQASDGR